MVFFRPPPNSDDSFKVIFIKNFLHDFIVIKSRDACLKCKLRTFFFKIFKNEFTFVQNLKLTLKSKYTDPGKSNGELAVSFFNIAHKFYNEAMKFFFIFEKRSQKYIYFIIW
jgi:hypothetical protein